MTSDSFNLQLFSTINNTFGLFDNSKSQRQLDTMGNEELNNELKNINNSLSENVRTNNNNNASLLNQIYSGVNLLNINNQLLLCNNQSSVSLTSSPGSARNPDSLNVSNNYNHISYTPMSSSSLSPARNYDLNIEDYKSASNLDFLNNYLNNSNEMRFTITPSEINLTVSSPFNATDKHEMTATDDFRHDQVTGNGFGGVNISNSDLSGFNFNPAIDPDSLSVITAISPNRNYDLDKLDEFNLDIETQFNNNNGHSNSNLTLNEEKPQKLNFSNSNTSTEYNDEFQVNSVFSFPSNSDSSLDKKKSHTRDVSLCSMMNKATLISPITTSKKLPEINTNMDFRKSDSLKTPVFQTSVLDFSRKAHKSQKSNGINKNHKKSQSLNHSLTNLANLDKKLINCLTPTYGIKIPNKFSTKKIDNDSFVSESEKSSDENFFFNNESVNSFQDQVKFEQSSSDEIDEKNPFDNDKSTINPSKLTSPTASNFYLQSKSFDFKLNDDINKIIPMATSEEDVSLANSSQQDVLKNEDEMELMKNSDSSMEFTMESGEELISEEDSDTPNYRALFHGVNNNKIIKTRKPKAEEENTKVSLKEKLIRKKHSKNNSIELDTKTSVSMLKEKLKSPTLGKKKKSELAGRNRAGSFTSSIDDISIANRASSIFSNNTGGISLSSATTAETSSIDENPLSHLNIVRESSHKKSYSLPVNSFIPVGFMDEDSTLLSPQQLQSQPTRRGRKPNLQYDPSKIFSCSMCPRKFKRQEHLKRHFRSLHTGEKPFGCSQCGKKFSRSDNLGQHMKTHTMTTKP